MHARVLSCRRQFGLLTVIRHGHLMAGTVGWLPGGSVAACEPPTGAGFVDGREEVLVASVIAFDVNETLLDLGALDEPFEVLLGSAALRPQWFTLMLQLAFTGGLTGRYVNFTTSQRAALAMLAEREGVPLTASDIDGLVGRMSSLPAHPEVPGALAALARTRLRLVALTNSVQHVAEAQLAGAGLERLVRGRAFSRCHRSSQACAAALPCGCRAVRCGHW